MNKRNRGNKGYSPTPEEVKEWRGDRTQKRCAEIIYTTDRVWRLYEAGKTRMHPLAWEKLLKYKE